MIPTRGITRRTMLAGSIAAIASSATLTACSTPSTSTSTGSVDLPARQPVSGVEPDLPGTATGVPDAFLSYPTDPVTTSSAPPGAGGTVVALLSSFAAAPPSPPRNTYWSGLNERLNVDLDLQVVPAADYGVKLATTISGNALPDIFEMLPAQPQLPQLLGATCTDLTPFLSGDAVLKYPNLATYTPDMWRTTIFGGKIYGVPVPRPIQSGVPFIRTDLFEQRGLSAEVGSWAELNELCAAISDRKASRFAFSMAPINYLMGALGGITEWGEEDGAFIRHHETEQYRQALVWCAELQKSGHLHPDAFAANATVLGKQRLVGGQVGIHPDGYSAWGSLARFLPRGQQQVIGGLDVAGFEGATPTYAVGAGSTNFTVLKKSEEPRTRELLAIMDYLAAPFGSAEFVYRKYGSPQEHHTLSDANPVLTDAGTDQVTPITEALDYHLADAVKVAYEGSLTEITRAKHAFALAAEPYQVRSAIIGLYSDTLARRNNTFNTMIADVQNGIITGRRPLSDLDEALSTWNKGDGAVIKDELAKARENQ